VCAGPGVEGRAFFETEAAASLAAYAFIHGAQPLADLLGVGKDWVYRRLSGETPIRQKDEWLIEKLGDLLEPQKKPKVEKRVARKLSAV
jgi:hypothetical protein